jgi:hypothetical protein
MVKLTKQRIFNSCYLREDVKEGSKFEYFLKFENMQDSIKKSIFYRLIKLGYLYIDFQDLAIRISEDGIRNLRKGSIE